MKTYSKTKENILGCINSPDFMSDNRSLSNNHAVYKVKITNQWESTGMKEHACSRSFMFAVFDIFAKTHIRVRSCSIFREK